MAAGKSADLERSGGGLPPRLEMRAWGQGIIRSTESENSTRQRRTWRRVVRLQSCDVGSQSRQEQSENILMIQDLLRNSAISSVDFGDEFGIRKRVHWRRDIGDMRRAPAGNDQVRRHWQGPCGHHTRDLKGEH